MEPDVYIPLLSALVGALVGSAGTVATVWVQARREDRRDRRELAFRIASEQQARHIETAEKSSDGGNIMPIDAYLAHSFALVKAVENGPLTVKVLKQISAEVDPLYAHLLAEHEKAGNQAANPPAASPGQT
jgi:hypothetical protein